MFHFIGGCPRGRANGIAATTLLLFLLLAGCGGGSDVEPPPPPLPVILTQSIPDGTLTLPYNATLQVVGIGPFTWTLASGTLPPGLTLDSDGTISGTPTQNGVFNLTVQVVDGFAQVETMDYTILVGLNANPSVTRVTIGFDGSQANGDSGTPSASGDGRLIVFTSLADNLIANDTNNFADIFVFDRSCNQTGRVNIPQGGGEANNIALASTISADGRFVAYASDASNLVANDTNNLRDLFVTVLDTTTCPPTPLSTTRASVGFDSTGALIESDNISTLPSLPADGAFVVYQSRGSTLVDLDTNFADDVFLTDLQFTGGVLTATGTRRISVFLEIPPTAAEPGCCVTDTTIGNSALTLMDDELVDFQVEIVSGMGVGQTRSITANDATTLTVDPAWDTLPDATSVFRVVQQGSGVRAHASSDGRLVAFETRTAFEDEDTNNVEDVFLHEVATGVVTRVSVDDMGMLADRTSNASGLNSDGSVVLMRSSATNLIPNDTNNQPDMYLRELVTPTTTRVSVASDGTETDAGGDIAAGVSGDGNLAVFTSFATNLVADDRNFFRDVFLHNVSTGDTRRLSMGLDGVNPNAESFDAAISLDGSAVVFASEANNLVVGDTNSFRDIFLYTTGMTAAPIVVSNRLPPAQAGLPYAASLRAVGGTEPLFWVAAQGKLPAGLFLDPRSGALRGVPRAAGRFAFTVAVLDSERPMRITRKKLTLVVHP